MRVYIGGGVEERKTPSTGMAPPATEDMPTTAASKVEEAGRLPSIEMEPKTLTLDQIKYAREAALYVVSTKSEEEAIRIFTAGLKPVQMNSSGSSNGRSCSKSGSMDSSSDDDVDLGYGGGHRDGGGSNTCGRDQHTKSGGARGRRRPRRQHSIDDIRDIATAPF